MREDTIIVKVARVGAPTIEVCLNGAREISDALKAANISPKATEAFKVNDETVDEDYELENGDTLVLTKNIFGGR